MTAAVEDFSVYFSPVRRLCCAHRSSCTDQTPAPGRRENLTSLSGTSCVFVASIEDTPGPNWSRPRHLRSTLRALFGFCKVSAPFSERGCLSACTISYIEEGASFSAGFRSDFKRHFPPAVLLFWSLFVPAVSYLDCVSSSCRSTGQARQERWP